jgi:hypothetical protein
MVLGLWVVGLRDVGKERRRREASAPVEVRLDRAVMFDDVARVPDMKDTCHLGTTR